MTLRPEMQPGGKEHILLHKLWTIAADRPGYVKEDWLALEKALEDQYRIGGIGMVVGHDTMIADLRDCVERGWERLTYANKLVAESRETNHQHLAVIEELKDHLVFAQARIQKLEAAGNLCTYAEAALASVAPIDAWRALVRG